MSRDTEYEQTHQRYYSGEMSVECINHRLCGAVLMPQHFEHYHNYLCRNCDMFAWGPLEFEEGQFECSVCLQDVDCQMKFPACSHKFCVDCSKTILYYDETRFQLSPVPYGCPPCPNGCTNPIRGRQCYCEEYDAVQEAWEQTNPVEYHLWNELEHASIDIGDPPGSVYASKTCPVCRSVWDVTYH